VAHANVSGGQVSHSFKYQCYLPCVNNTAVVPD